MKDYPKPMSDDFINVSPEAGQGDCCQWVLVEIKGWDTEKKSSDRGHENEQDRLE